MSDKDCSEYECSRCLFKGRNKIIWSRCKYNARDHVVIFPYWTRTWFGASSSTYRPLSSPPVSPNLFKRVLRYCSLSQEMASKREPLCQFSDRWATRKLSIELVYMISRLYFTTFPHPPPSSQVLNKLAADPENQPRLRVRPRGGPSSSPDENASYYYFTIDDQLLYLSFFQDWGPLNLSMVYKACILIHELLEVRRAI